MPVAACQSCQSCQSCLGGDAGRLTPYARPTRAKVLDRTDSSQSGDQKSRWRRARPRRQGHPRLPSGSNSCLLVESRRREGSPNTTADSVVMLSVADSSAHLDGTPLHSAICSVHAAPWAGLQAVANPSLRLGLERSAHVQRSRRLAQRDQRLISPREARPLPFSTTVDATATCTEPPPPSCSSSFTLIASARPSTSSSSLFANSLLVIVRPGPAAKSNIYPVAPKADAPFSLLRA